MTTGELIALLREADPDGNTPVCVDNADVYIVERLPAYYDGALQQLIHNESKRPYWTIVGANLTRRGIKVKIHPLSIDEIMIDMPDLPVTLDANDEYGAKRVARWREEARLINNDDCD